MGMRDPIYVLEVKVERLEKQVSEMKKQIKVLNDFISNLS